LSTQTEKQKRSRNGASFNSGVVSLNNLLRTILQTTYSCNQMDKMRDIVSVPAICSQESSICFGRS